MRDSISVGRAIIVGLFVVNGPVMVFLLGPLATFAMLVERGTISRDFNWMGLLAFAGGFVVAWTWWSLAVPRWRVWAYERVDDIRMLKERAVAVGLTWPDNHPFGRTEIKPLSLRRREQELDGENRE